MGVTIANDEVSLGSLAPSAFATPRATRSAGRRLLAFLIDLALLGAGLTWVMVAEVGLGEGPDGSLDGPAGWLPALWAFVIGPLYFGLYHAYGTGATPGQQELGLAVLDRASVRPSGFWRGMARSVLGLVETILVLPIVVDLAVTAGRGRSWRDAVLGLEVAELPSCEPVILPPTLPELASVFTVQPLGPSRWHRARELRRLRGRPIFRSLLACYLVGLGLALLLVGMFADALLIGGEESAGVVAVALLAIGLVMILPLLYWSQVVGAQAVEAVRTGADSSVATTLRRSTTRLNGLAALALVFLTTYYVVGILAGPAVLLVLGRLALVVPALALEERRVFQSIGRSWTLTRGHTGGLFVAALLVALALAGGVAAIVLVGVLVGAAVLSVEGVLAGVLLVMAILLVLAVPITWGLSLAATWWMLTFYDLRHAAEGERG